MAQKPRPGENVVRLFTDDDVAEEIAIGHKLLAEPAISPSSGPALDLTGKPKVMLTFGAGGAGKTTWLRWAVEQVLERNTGATLAAIDPENRDLGNFFANVYEPPSRDQDKVAAWLRAFFDAMVRDKTSGLVDTGGGDTAFGRVFSDIPTMVEDMDREGLTMVAVHLFSNRVADLSHLATLSGAGFNPPATALILNEGALKSGTDPAQAFAAIRRHSVYRAALDRGAIELRMPRLDPASKIEARSAQYRHARDGIVAEGIKAIPLGWSDRSAVRAWLLRMSTAMAPIASWIP